MNKYTEDQFSVCTPEEEAFFQEIENRNLESQERDWLNLLKEEKAVDALMAATFVWGKGPLLYGQEVALRMIYQAIKDGKIPGVVLEEGHGY